MKGQLETCVARLADEVERGGDLEAARVELASADAASRVAGVAATDASATAGVSASAIFLKGSGMAVGLRSGRGNPHSPDNGSFTQPNASPIALVPRRSARIQA